MIEKKRSKNLAVIVLSCSPQFLSSSHSLPSFPSASKSLSSPLNLQPLKQPLSLSLSPSHSLLCYYIIHFNSSLIIQKISWRIAKIRYSPSPFCFVYGRKESRRSRASQISFSFFFSFHELHRWLSFPLLNSM